MRYIDVRTNPEYKYDEVIGDINYNFSLCFSYSGGTITGDTNFTGALMSGGTNLYDIFSTRGGSGSSGNFLPLSGGTVTGNTNFTQTITATTITANTIYGGVLMSGGTNIYDIFAIAGSTGGPSTFVQPGLNTYTGGTPSLPTVNVTGGTFNSLVVTGNTILSALTYVDGNYASGKVLTSDANGNATWEYPESLSTQTYMFFSGASDIATYNQAVALPVYTTGLTATITTNISTTPTLMAVFATNENYPNVTVIPAGSAHIHYETEKSAGSNNYYSYAEIYKRTTGGTETLLTTSDFSTETASNAIQQITVTAFLSNNIYLNSTDRIIVKIYGVMLSSTANVNLYYDDNTNSRIELPISIAAGTNLYVPYSGANSNVNIGSFSINAGIIYSAGTDLYTIFALSGSTGGQSTLVQPGSNITTGGTSSAPVVSVVDSPSFNNLTFSGTSIGGSLSIVNMSASTSIFSAGTNIESLFVRPNNVQTITNKRITKRVVVVPTSANPTLNTDICDIARLTGLTSNVTSFTTNLTGTPDHGDMFSYEITDSGVARTLSWGASFGASGTLALPTTTVISTLLKVLFQYNSASGLWVIAAVV